MQQAGAAWLQIHRIPPPMQDLRPSVADEGPTWGFHLDDMNLALGDLILDVAYEEASYR